MLPFEFSDEADAYDKKPPEVPSPRRNSQESPYANDTYNGTYSGTDGSPSEKLQRRSWRTASPTSSQRRQSSITEPQSSSNVH